MSKKMSKKKRLAIWPHPITANQDYVREFPITTKELEAMAKTAKKKVAKKASTKKAGSAKARVGKGVKSEPTAPLPGMEEIDEKIPAIDDYLAKILANDTKRAKLKVDNEALSNKISGIMAEKKIESYSTPTASVRMLHGEDVIQIKKVKQK